MSAHFPHNVETLFNIVRRGRLSMRCDCNHCRPTKARIFREFMVDRRMRWTRGELFVLTMMKLMYERRVPDICIMKEYVYWSFFHSRIYHIGPLDADCHPMTRTRRKAGTMILNYLRRCRFNRVHILRKAVSTVYYRSGRSVGMFAAYYLNTALLRYEIGRERVEYVCSPIRVACRKASVLRADYRQNRFVETLYLTHLVEEQFLVHMGLKNALIKYLY